MDKFRHVRPHESTENPSRHTIDLIVDGERVGTAQLQYLSRPFPLYRIASLDVSLEKRGRGFGGKVMTFIEDMLRQKSKAGILVDAIEPESPAHGMYARRGWRKVPDSKDLYAFNLPTGASVDQLRKYEWRYQDYEDRQGWKKHTDDTDDED